MFYVSMPEPEQMHGAGDGFGGEDTPHSPAVRKSGRVVHVTNEELIRQLHLVTEISVEPGISLEIAGTPTHSVFPTERRFTLVVYRGSKDYGPEWEHPKFNNVDDYVGYRWIGHCFYFEDRSGEMLIGDQLPTTEKEAKLVCRVANMAVRHAQVQLKQSILKAINDATSKT
jgi:hypothetical protein